MSTSRSVPPRRSSTAHVPSLRSLKPTVNVGHSSGLSSLPSSASNPGVTPGVAGGGASGDKSNSLWAPVAPPVTVVALTIPSGPNSLTLSSHASTVTVGVIITGL